MMELVPKSTSINLRITPQFRKELQQLADYRGLTLSSLAHSLLIRAMRQEKANEPDAFAESERKVYGIKPAPSRKLPHLGKVNEKSKKVRDKRVA